MAPSGGPGAQLGTAARAHGLPRNPTRRASAGQAGVGPGPGNVLATFPSLASRQELSNGGQRR